jgi:hypothetical protein
MRLLYRIALSLSGGIILGAVLAAFHPQKLFGTDFLTTGLLLATSLFFLLTAWDWARAGKKMLWMMALAFFLRLGLGLFLEWALPAWGYLNSEPQQAGYVFFDAFRRDMQAWQLASTGGSLLHSFTSEFYSDQYGGMLALSAAVYRFLSPDAHRPHLILILTAMAGSLGIPFLYRAVCIRFNERIATLSAWILVFYPELILLGSSQMREPFLIALGTIAFWAVCYWERASEELVEGKLEKPSTTESEPMRLEDQKQVVGVKNSLFGPFSPLAKLRPRLLLHFGQLRQRLLPITEGEIKQADTDSTSQKLVLPKKIIPNRLKVVFVFVATLMGMGLFSSRVALAVGVVLVVWFWLDVILPKVSPRGKWIGWIVLAIAGAGLAGLSWLWLRSSAALDLFMTVYTSGYLTRIIAFLPDFLHIPFLVAYGLMQPILPAALAETAIPLWKAIVIFRSLGWYVLAPFLLYAFIAIWFTRPDKDFLPRDTRRILIWLALFCLGWVLLSSARAGGDPWDNPRYRALFLPWLALLAAWVCEWVRQKRGAWMRWLVRVFLAEGVFLAVFLHWYLSRYLNLWKKLSFWPTLALVIGLMLLTVVVSWVWERIRIKRHKPGENGARFQGDA